MVKCSCEDNKKDEKKMPAFLKAKFKKGAKGSKGSKGSKKGSKGSKKGSKKK